MKSVLVLGSFVVDTAYRAARLPGWGETIMGAGFALGPGGKGSNQAVAAARTGAKVQMFSKVGDDAFGRIGRELWREAGIDDSLTGVSEVATGAAAILIDDARGENAIIVVPGACFTLTADEVSARKSEIAAAGVLLVQLELDIATVVRGLEIARAAGVVTILNPAPAAKLPESIFALVDYLIPNETEAAALTGFSVGSIDEAKIAALALQGRGVGTVIVTLGEKGALVCEAGGICTVVAALNAGAVVETTGAGDAFCGGFAAALAEGQSVVAAVRFGCATAAISVTRAGTAPSMPKRDEIDALLKG